MSSTWLNASSGTWPPARNTVEDEIPAPNTALEAAVGVEEAVVVVVVVAAGAAVDELALVEVDVPPETNPTEPAG